MGVRSAEPAAVGLLIALPRAPGAGGRDARKQYHLLRCSVQRARFSRPQISDLQHCIHTQAVFAVCACNDTNGTLKRAFAQLAGAPSPVLWREIPSACIPPASRANVSALALSQGSMAVWAEATLGSLRSFWRRVPGTSGAQGPRDQLGVVTRELKRQWLGGPSISHGNSRAVRPS